MHHVTKLKSYQTDFLNMTIVHCTPVEFGDLHHGFVANVCCYCVNMDQHVWNVSNTLFNLCHEELRHIWRHVGVRPSTSKVYLIKWLAVLKNGRCHCCWQHQQQHTSLHILEDGIQSCILGTETIQTDNSRR